MPGRHAAPVESHFYRDLAVMVLGIAVVGALAFLLLSVFFGSDTPSTDEAGVSTTVTTASSAVSSTPTSVASATSQPVPTATTTTTKAVRAPSEIRVQVLNAVGVAGLASDVSTTLGSLGYQTLTPGNYQPTLAESRIWFLPDFAAEAFELAEAAFPDALVEENPDLGVDADIVVVLGESFEP